MGMAGCGFKLILGLLKDLQSKDFHLPDFSSKPGFQKTSTRPSGCPMLELTLVQLGPGKNNTGASNTTSIASQTKVQNFGSVGPRFQESSRSLIFNNTFASSFEFCPFPTAKLHTLETFQTNTQEPGNSSYIVCCCQQRTCKLLCNLEFVTHSI